MNQEKAIKYFTKITVNLSELYENLEYNQKRVLQKLLYPEGLQYSLKNKEYLTSKAGALFELTNCFSNTYDDKIKKTHQEKPDKSYLVQITSEKSNAIYEELLIVENLRIKNKLKYWHLF